jgi:hypothetical protein
MFDNNSRNYYYNKKEIKGKIMKPETKKLIEGIGTGVIGITVAILEYKFLEMPLFVEAIVDIVFMVGAYFGLKFSLRNK